MKRRLRAGKFRHRIAIEQAIRTRSEDGSYSESWSEFWQCAAMITTIGGREAYQARQTIGELTHEIYVRYYPGITTNMRVRYDDPKAETSRYFGIRAVINPKETREDLILRCLELNDGQSRA